MAITCNVCDKPLSSEKCLAQHEAGRLHNFALRLAQRQGCNAVTANVAVALAKIALPPFKDTHLWTAAKKLGERQEKLIGSLTTRVIRVLKPFVVDNWFNQGSTGRKTSLNHNPDIDLCVLLRSDVRDKEEIRNAFCNGGEFQVTSMLPLPSKALQTLLQLKSTGDGEECSVDIVLFDSSQEAAFKKQNDFVTVLKKSLDSQTKIEIALTLKRWKLETLKKVHTALRLKSHEKLILSVVLEYIAAGTKSTTVEAGFKEALEELASGRFPESCDGLKCKSHDFVVMAAKMTLQYFEGA